jgi:CRP/FNR family transcriptional regulator, anaerobic regulatory protein
MENFKKFTEELYQLNEEELNVLKQEFAPLAVKKMNHLIAEGDKVEELYFINSGFLRGYYIKDGEEFTTAFYYGPIFLTDIFAIRNNSKTVFNLQVVKNSDCYKANFKAIENLMDTYPNIRLLFYKFYEKTYMQAVDRKLSFLYDSQKERYLKLVTNHPELFDDIPLQYIASYLAIKPETLSRIRKKL